MTEPTPDPTPDPTLEHVDVLIIGAGLSGIGAAAQLTRALPHKSYRILERRDASGGTWDLFRYPGVRSDSDMFTLGYRFKPWNEDKVLADGPAILRYVRETATEYGVDEHITYRAHVRSADWDSATARWTVTFDRDGQAQQVTCGLLWSCSGYYDYDAGYRPTWPGEDSYAGQVVHPQHWPEDFDAAGKRVVVIGSGATAVTLVPALAEAGAEHVTMLQRTPTYVLAVPAVDKIAIATRRVLGNGLAYGANRWRAIGVATGLFQFSQRRPGAARRLITRLAGKALPEGYALETHFNPPYDPWDQRMCLVPDGDLFRSISDGDAEVVTDTIDTFTPTGIRTGGGRELEADVVVTATGLNLLAFGGLEFTVDDELVSLPDTVAYKALMLSGLPNFVYTIGYTNASWTLKADLVAEYVCRLLGHLDAHGYTTAVPVPSPELGREPFMDFSAGYVLRSIDDLPRQGDVEPWKLKQNYFFDIRSIRRGAIDDGALQFR